MINNCFTSSGGQAFPDRCDAANVTVCHLVDTEYVRRHPPSSQRSREANR